MKVPSKTKLGFDLVLGGMMLGVAAGVRPYDWLNGLCACLGLLWIVGAAIELDRYHD